MEEKEFYQLGEKFIKEMLKAYPVTATYMGLHKWDGQLASYNPSALKDLKQLFKDYKDKFNQVKLDDFSKDAQIDHQLVVQLIKSNLRELEEFKVQQRNPNSYVNEMLGGIMSLIMKDFAPLEIRLESVISRLAAIPQLLEQAQQNLKAEVIPLVWVETALEQLRLAPALLEELLPNIAQEHAPKLKEKLTAKANQAAKAVKDYIKFLESEIKPNAQGDFAVGEEMFNQLLAENHLVDYDAKELLEQGWEIFNQTQEKMEKLAQKIDPDKSAKEIMAEAKKDHPTADDLLDTYRESMQKSRQFVIDNDIATLPENEKLTIIATPEYLRPIIPFAAYMQPGIFADELEGIFMVTPVDETADKKQQAEKLKGHYSAKIPITTLHEGYPGHHLQLSMAATSDSNLRKLGSFLSTLFVEGWAFYCEELMEELGFINQPIQKLGRLSDQLWRAARIILDVKLHCEGMDVETAVDFLVDNCQLERSNALAEIRRYTSSPTQPQSYLMGKKEILKVIDSYKQKHPKKDLKEVHDDILAAGSLPPKLMRRQLEC